MGLMHFRREAEMRFLLLPYAAWMGVLPLTGPVALASDLPRLFAVASVLGSLTVLVYRLGVWRQEMENTRTNVGAEVRSHREESASNFARMERQLEALDHMITDYMEFKQQASRWQRSNMRRLERLEEKDR
jgi:uncharacterized protein YdcH (DUF465 family)